MTIANKIMKNIENPDLKQENLPKICSCYYLKPIFIKTETLKNCLCKKQIKRCGDDCDFVRKEVQDKSNIEIEEILIKPKSKQSPSSEYKSKLLSTLLKNENENKDNNNYTFFGIFFCGLGLGLGTYYFYRKTK
jgi:hypothetical protein